MADKLELAKAYIQIVPSADGFKSKLEASIGDEADKAGKSAGQKWSGGFGSTLKSVGAASAKAAGAAVLAAAAGAVAITKEAVQAYAEYEQLVGGVDTLFGTASDQVVQYAQEAYQTAGISANEYMATVTSFAASLKQATGDNEEAARAANQAVIDMADNANKMGTSMESIQNAYQGFAKQNYTMLDNLKLGYGGTKEEMERLLEDAEKFSGVKYDINNLSDVYEAIHVVQTELGITGTTAEEASETISGSIASTKAAWENLLVGLASGNADIDGLVQNLMDSAMNVLNNVSPVVETVLAQLPTVITAIVEMIGQMLPTLLETVTTLFQSILESLVTMLPELMPVIVQAVVTIVQTLLENLGSIIDAAIQIILAIVQGITQALPDLIPAAVDAVIQICTTLIDNIDLIIDAAIELILALALGLIEAIPKLIEAVPKLITSLVTKLTEPAMMSKMINAAIQLVVGLVKGLIQAIPRLLSAVGQIGSAVWNGLKSAFASIWQVGSNIVSGIWRGISDGLGWIKDRISGWVGNVVSFIKGLFGIKSPSTVMRDQVGVYLAEGIGVGFEEEMDSVAKDMVNTIPTDFSSNLSMMGDIGRAGAQAVSNSNVTINVYGAEGQDVDELANIIMQKLQMSVDRRGAVYA